MYVNAFKWAAIVVAAAVVACGIILYKKKGLLPFGKRKDRQPGEENAAKAIAAGIQNHAELFDGLYEGLYQAVNNRDLFMTDAYAEWCARVAQTGDVPFQDAFSGLFTKANLEDEPLCRNKMERLLGFIADAGMVRERENKTVYTADEAMHKAYFDESGGKPEVGKEYTVIKSAWVNGEQVVEYGMVMSGSFVF